MVAENTDKGIIVDPQGKFKKALRAAGKKSQDLRIPFREITASWYKVNMALFTFKSKGPFKDLSKKYKKVKRKKWKFVYPILKASGKLEASLTVPTDPNTIASVLNKKTLILGTKVTTLKGAPYPTYLQTGTSKMPARPFMVLGTEKGKWAKSTHVQRRLIFWMEVLAIYIADTLRKGDK